MSGSGSTIIDAGEHLYRSACETGDLPGFLSRCSDASLRQLHGHLARRGEINGVPGNVWSHVLLESSRRFMIMNVDQGGAR